MSQNTTGLEDGHNRPPDTPVSVSFGPSPDVPHRRGSLTTVADFKLRVAGLAQNRPVPDLAKIAVFCVFLLFWFRSRQTRSGEAMPHRGRFSKT
jgi:hypothetical protein